MKRTIAISITAMLLLASCATKTEGVSLGILQTTDSKATVASNVDSAMESEAVEEEWDIVSNDAIPTDDRFEEQISATDDGKDEPSDRIEAVVQPIVRHYTYEGYDFSLSAYPGRLYLVHPDELDAQEIDLLASYLLQRHPQQLKDVTYKDSDGVLVVTYPESWGVDELDYAQSVLMEDLSEFDAKKAETKLETPTETPMQDQFEEDSQNTIAEVLEEELSYESTEIPMSTSQPFVEEQPLVLASEEEWWNDPIFEGSYVPSVEAEPVQNEEGMEIQASEDIVDLEAFDWKTDDVPETSIEAESTPNSTFEDIESNAMQSEVTEVDLHQKGFADKAKALLLRAKEHAMRLKDAASKKLKEASFEDKILIGLAVLFALVLIVVLAAIGSKGRKERKRRKEFVGSSSEA